MKTEQHIYCDEVSDVLTHMLEVRSKFVTTGMQLHHFQGSHSIFIALICLLTGNFDLLKVFNFAFTESMMHLSVI